MFEQHFAWIGVLLEWNVIKATDLVSNAEFKF